MYFDCDTHVDECEDTWARMPEDMRAFSPVTTYLDRDSLPPYIRPGYERAWFIDGQLFTRQIRSDERTGTTLGIRQLSDVGARLRDMDSLGVGVQILYPTAFLTELSLQPSLQSALCQSYNRWLADRCAESNGRIHWVAMVPLVDMESALTEMRWAREHGAVGVYKRSVEAHERPAGDRYFHPFYSLARELDMPVCIHTGQGWNAVVGHLAGIQSLNASTLLGAFNSIIRAKIPGKYPGLRFAFIEEGAGWVPYALWLSRADTNLVGFSNRAALDPDQIAKAAEAQRGILDELNIWVTCEVSEDLSYLVDVLGDDHLFVGSDYGHPDRASIRDAHGRVFGIAGIKPESADRMTRINGAEFYGLSIP